MKIFLSSKDCWEAVVNGFTEPDPADVQAVTNEQRNALKELRKYDSKAL
jgi:hypothetical protein